MKHVLRSVGQYKVDLGRFITLHNLHCFYMCSRRSSHHPTIRLSCEDVGEYISKLVNPRWLDYDSILRLHKSEGVERRRCGALIRQVSVGSRLHKDGRILRTENQRLISERTTIPSLTSVLHRFDFF